jgi:membrane-associated HD superfamily phosphohydrolase
LLLSGLYLAMLGASAAGAVVADILHGQIYSLGVESVSLLVPVPAGAAVAAMLLSPAAGVLLAIAAGAAVGLLGGPSVGFLQATLVAAGWLFAGRARFELPPLDLATALGAAFLSGAVLLPLVAVTLVPLLERLLGLASDIRLRDLASLNHPALKELIVQAPGT